MPTEESEAFGRMFQTLEPQQGRELGDVAHPEARQGALDLLLGHLLPRRTGSL